MCSGEISRSPQLAASFSCTDSCCSSFVTNTNIWHAVEENYPGREDAKVTLEFDPIDFRNVFFDTTNPALRGATLRQILIEIPSGWQFTSKTNCMIEFEGQGSEFIQCPQQQLDGETYALTEIGSSSDERFKLTFTHIETPSSVNVLVNQTSARFIFDGLDHSYGTYLRVAQLQVGQLSEALFYSSSAYPGAVSDAFLTFVTESKVPAGGYIEATFSSSEWEFQNTEWFFGQVNTNLETRHNAEKKSWLIRVPDPLSAGRIQLRASRVRTPSVSAPTSVRIRTLDANRRPIEEGVAPGSPVNIASVNTDGPSPYNYVSIVIFLISLIFCSIVTRINGLKFSKLSIWTDITATCALTALSLSIVNNAMWLFIQKSYYYYVTRARLCVTFVMLLAVCFHWGTVLSLRLRKVPRTTTAILFVFLVSIFCGFQLYFLIENSDVIEHVYDAETNPLSAKFQICKLGHKSAYTYRFSDIQAYFWKCYQRDDDNFYYWFEVGTLLIFVLLTILVMALGFMVMQRGKRLLQSVSGAQELLLQQALRLYYTLIGIVTVTYTVAWVMQIVLVDHFVDYPWWYIFVVWLPNAVPTCCFVFLQWNTTAATLRKADQMQADEEYAQVRTPSIAFSNPERWSTYGSDSFIEESTKGIAPIEGQILGETKQVGVSMKFATATDSVPAACHVVIEARIAENELWERIDSTDSCTKPVDQEIRHIFAFLAIPQLDLPRTEGFELRFIIVEDQESESLKIANVDELTEELIDYDSDNEDKLQRSDSGKLNKVCEFTTNAIEIISALEAGKQLKLTDGTGGSEDEDAQNELFLYTLQTNHPTKDAHTITRQFHIQEQKIVVVEDLTESTYSNDIPKQLLEQNIQAQTRKHLQAVQDLERFDAFYEKHVKSTVGGMYETLIDQIQDDGDQKKCRIWMEQRISRMEQYLQRLRKLRRTCVIREQHNILFKPSVEKKNPTLRHLPINLQLQQMRISSAQEMMKIEDDGTLAVYDTVTVGAMAAHCYKFKNGGMLRMTEQREKMIARSDVSPPPSTPYWTEAERTTEELEWQIQIRMDVCLPQAVAALVTAFTHKVDLALQNKDPIRGNAMLEQWMDFGFLFQIESLLSTHGNEVGMLEDMTVAINELESVEFMLMSDTTNTVEAQDVMPGVVNVKVFPDRASALGEPTNEETIRARGYVIRILVRCSHVSLPAQLEGGQSINVLPLIFTQGINEAQTLAFTTGASIVQLQEDINDENLTRLARYTAAFKNFVLRSRYVQAFPSIELVDTEFKIVSEAVINATGRKKHPEILELTSDYCRLLGSGRVTVCKSAKDRTSMSVTLEQGRILAKYHGLPKRNIPGIVRVMRSSGVRLENASKNTGRRMFAFNAFQRSLLPEKYRCPPRTGGKNVS